MCWPHQYLGLICLVNLFPLDFAHDFFVGADVAVWCTRKIVLTIFVGVYATICFGIATDLMTISKRILLRGAAVGFGLLASIKIRGSLSWSLFFVGFKIHLVAVFIVKVMMI